MITFTAPGGVAEQAPSAPLTLPSSMYFMPS